MAVAWVLGLGLGIIALMVIIGISNWLGYCDGMKDTSKIHENDFREGWDKGAEYHRGKNMDWFDTGWKGMGKTIINLMETAEDIQLEGSFGKYDYTPTARDWQAIKNGLRKAIEKEEGE